VSDTRGISQSFAKGAAWGAATWIVYGIVEAVLSISIQLWRFPEMEVLVWQWRWIAMFLGVYAIIGLLLGAVGGLLLTAKRGEIEGDHRIFAVWTVSLAFAANLVRAWPPARSELIVLFVAVALVGAFSLALLSANWRKPIRFLASPWTVALLLLGVPCLSRELLTPQDSSAIKIGASFGLVFVILACAAFWNAFRQDHRGDLRGQGLLGTAVLGLFVIAASAARRGAPARFDAAAAAPDKPNVLLIVMDTVRAGNMSLYGYQRDTTPNLRQFAQTATVYKRAIAASDFTLATHATMFTGLYPDWNGAIQSASPGTIALPLHPQHATVAEMLRSMGYWTVESAANYGFLAPWTGLTRGFAVSDLTRPVVLSSKDRPFYLREMARRMLGFFVNTGPLDQPSRISSDINRRAIAYLEQIKANSKPFFLFVNYMDAHTPYVSAPPFDTRFGSSRRLNPSDLHDVKLRVDGGKRRLRPEESRALMAAYDGGIAAEDTAIADLLHRLRELGLYDKTFIIVTADHGDTFGEHDLMDHFLGFVYQELVHVPLVVKYPGQHEGKTSDELVSQVDLMPTVLDALGVMPPSELQGRSLLKPSGPEEIVYSRGTRSPLVGLGNQRFEGQRRAIFSGSLKLITWTAGPPELYDLAQDPQELHNLYASDDPRAIDLTQRIEKWAAAMPRQNLQPTKLDKSAAEKLRSLGYVQ
jgi:arylsulfatase A-like enzyme